MCICKTGGFSLRTVPQLSGQAVPTRGCSAREGLCGTIWANGPVGRLGAGPSLWSRPLLPAQVALASVAMAAFQFEVNKLFLLLSRHLNVSLGRGWNFRRPGVPHSPSQKAQGCESCL